MRASHSWHKPPGAPEFVVLVENYTESYYESSGFIAGVHQFKVRGRNSTGLGPESEVVTVTVG